MTENDQKLENLLNLALDASAEERRRSAALETGYDGDGHTWQVIVRYSGTLEGQTPADWEVVELSGGYAIVTLPGNAIRDLGALPQIEYVEMPKRLYFALDAGRTASCVPAVQTPQFALTGRGILVALIDSGVDYFHPDFRDEDGNTRIVAMWDQTGTLRESGGSASGGGEAADDGPASARGESAGDELASGGGEAADGGLASAGRRPDGFSMGVEYTQEEINEALAAGSRAAGYAIVPERDADGHGTQVLGIAAGNGRASGGRYRGMAPESGLIVVKLGIPRKNGFPRTAELMQALEYVARRAGELGMPVAVNISIGSVYGSHRGTSLLETYINMMANRGRSVIAVGTGNEGNTGGHASGRLVPGQSREIEFLVSDYETALNLQIWKDYADEFEITLISPDRRRIGPLGRAPGTARYQTGSSELLVYYGEPGPYQGWQEIYLDFIPDDTYLDSGVWSIRLSPARIVTGGYEMWLADGRSRGGGTRFLQPSPDTTITIPATASGVIAVGAYDARSRSYAPFSGRGWPGEGKLSVPKPDLTAPGVEVTTTAVGGGYVSVSGTSFAAPFVTGAAALLMQWGITDGNDPYLYGEKVRACLCRGAGELPGFARYPNNQVGYGALCVKDSLPL